MKKNKKNILTSKKFIHLLYLFIRQYSSTFRLEVINENKWLDHLNNGGKVILCPWHQQFFSFIRYFQEYKDLKPSLMISQSADGELIAGVANRTGWYTARGSSSHGGRNALEEMIDKIKETGLAAHILDGPQGPSGIVKNGAIKMAMETNAALVPLYSTTKNDWHASSWDKFIIPKPFSEVKIVYGDPILFKPTDDVKKMEEYRKILETKMKPFLKYF